MRKEMVERIVSPTRLRAGGTHVQDVGRVWNMLSTGVSVVEPQNHSA